MALTTNNYLRVDSTWASAEGPTMTYSETAGTTSVYMTNSISVPESWPNEVKSEVKRDRSHEPQVYFRYIKSKFRPLERRSLDRKLQQLEKAFDVAVKAGQNVMAEKFLQDFIVRMREAEMYAHGVREYIERDDVMKYRHSIRGGHISDTQLRDFTRVIPKKVLKKKEKVESAFDGFVIFHYWDENAPDVKRMSEKEKSRMKDPVLFGIIKENNRLYFIADWEDDYCDLSFSEMTKVVSKMRL